METNNKILQAQSKKKLNDMNIKSCLNYEQEINSSEVQIKDVIFN